MKPLLTILLILAITLTGYAQEICNNGIDDDGNGLIDLQDPACSCRDSLPPLNYLRNPSFEKYEICPADYNGGSGLGLDHFPDWVSAPFSGDVFYYNSNCINTQFGSCPPPYPLSDGGNGYIMMQNIGDIGTGSKNYAATCPDNTLRAGRKYTFECFIGLGATGADCREFYGPIHLMLFGNPDCTANKFTDFISSGCPTVFHAEKDNHDWVELGSAFVYPKSNWEKVRIDFTPDRDINLFLVGPDCVNNGPGSIQYFYADNFSLSAMENFNYKTIAVTNDCSTGIQLKAPPASNATYQWYKDSIAIAGATADQYTVPRAASKGNYNVRLLFTGSCIISSTVTLDPDTFKGLTLGGDTTLCIGEQLRLHANIPGLQYLWPDGTTDSTFIVKQAGNYKLTVKDSYGCSSSSSIDVNFKECTNCPVHIPSAFTPNSDGHNDVFKALTDCSLVSDFSLSIYNRWGQKIFETNDVTNGWNGMQRGQLSPVGVYVYRLQFKRYGTTGAIQQYGTVTLIR